MLTQPLEARTIKWGFQRGPASRLVKGGVKSPPAKWLSLMYDSVSPGRIAFPSFSLWRPTFTTRLSFLAALLFFPGD